MTKVRSLTDGTAISLSLLCAIHCLVFPMAMVLMPSLAALPLNSEAFHLWMVVAVIPTSVFALTMGCKKHKRTGVALTGSLGLLTLCAAALIGEEALGVTLEKTLTVIGAAMIASGHYWNYRLCSLYCDCPDKAQ